MFKKLFSTAAILLLAASQSATASSAKSDKGNNCAGNPAQEMLIKLTLARQFAVQFVGIYSLGDGDTVFEGFELDALFQIAADAAGVPVETIRKTNAIPLADGEASIDELTATVLKVWQDTCAADMKDMLDGVILPRIPGYNVDFVLTGADDA